MSCCAVVLHQQAREEEGNASKKPRVVWSVEMHQQFVQAVNQLGIDSECLLDFVINARALSRFRCTVQVHSAVFASGRGSRCGQLAN